uniref:Tail protein n=1 Tax=Salmonella phage vB_SEnST11_KE22 TaxID=3161173 RepID=A0AAU8GF64_9CAUD
MYPIPCFFLTLSGGGTEPLPPGSVKKIAFTRDQTTGIKRSMAILLTDGRLYAQGDNAWGECADGTVSPFYDHWNLAAQGVADVFGAGKAFVVKYNSGGWQFCGDLSQFTGSGGIYVTWTSFPSSITGTVALADLASVSGANGNTLWLMTNGRLYGSGTNSNGCLGANNTNIFSTPRSISASCLRAFSLNACVTYLNNVGTARVCGMTYSINGTTTTQTQSFIDVAVAPTTNVDTGITAPVYVKEWMSNESNSIAIGSYAADDNDNYLFCRNIVPGFTTSTYVKVSDFGPFTDFRVIDGGQSRFFIADNVLYGIGDVPRNLGLGTTDSTQVSTPTPVPVPTGKDWDLSKLTYIADMKGNTLTSGGTFGHWMVYDNNLYYTGFSYGFFNSNDTSYVFVNVPESSFEGTTADAITTGSIPYAIKGSKGQMTWTVEPANAEIYDISFTSSAPNIATVDSNGIMTFLEEGSFDITMTAKTGSGDDAKTLTDTSGGYVSIFSVTTDSVPAKQVGDVFVFMDKNSPDYTPGPNIIGMEFSPANVDTSFIDGEFTTTDPSVVEVSPDGYLTCIASGDCRCGVRLIYREGQVEAFDDSYVSVLEPTATIPPDGGGIIT